MNALVPVILVGVGGAAGASARFVLAARVDTPGRDTLVVNVVGSFVLGVLTGGAVGGPAALALGTGFCGAFTTFSSFAVETTAAYDSAGVQSAGVIAALHLAGALAAVGVGGVVGALLL